MTDISIDKRLNIVIPIIRGDQTRLCIHSTPIMPETFQTYYLVLAKTFSAFAQNGLDPMSAPSVAAMVLKDVALNTSRAPGLNWWDGPDGVGGEGGLMAEMVRLSNAVVTAPGSGWATMPLRLALDKKLVDPEEESEVLSILTFFMVASRVAARQDRERLVRGMAAIYGLQTTLFNATEFSASLRTSTADGTTGAKSAAA